MPDYIHSMIASINSIGFRFDNSYHRLPDIFYTKLAPTQVRVPSVVMLNYGLAQSLGLDLSSLEPEEAAQLFAGNVLPEESQPLAQAYAGHQFGHFTMLGDGRAHLLGEHITPEGIPSAISVKICLAIASIRMRLSNYGISNGWRVACATANSSSLPHV